LERKAKNDPKTTYARKQGNNLRIMGESKKGRRIA
jgi:hypothetical protein